MSEPARLPASASRPQGPVLVLVGPPGAGKTTVGRLLADRWGLAFVDTDEIVEADEQMSVSDLFVERGEPAFRALEELAVVRALGAGPVVVALGGGAVMSGATRDVLRGRPVVFLDVGLTAASERVGLGVTRPLLLGNVRARLKTMLDARRPLYTEVAALVVPTDDRSVGEVADEVAGAVAAGLTT
jgi:shikimate kinase